MCEWESDRESERERERDTRTSCTLYLKDILIYCTIYIANKEFWIPSAKTYGEFYKRQLNYK